MWLFGKNKVAVALSWLTFIVHQKEEKENEVATCSAEEWAEKMPGLRLHLVSASLQRVHAWLSVSLAARGGDACVPRACVCSPVCLAGCFVRAASSSTRRRLRESNSSCARASGENEGCAGGWQGLSLIHI